MTGSFSRHRPVYPGQHGTTDCPTVHPLAAKAWMARINQAMTIVFVVLGLACPQPGRAADTGGLDWEQHPGAPVPVDAALVDANGAPTTLREVAEGRPLILAPGYFRCPNLCGVVRDDLFSALAAGQAGPHRVALLSIDPGETAADATAASNAVLDRYPATRFVALTGPAASLAAISDAAGFRARYERAAKQFLHPAGLVVLAPSGAVSSYLLGVGYAATDVERAVADAEAERFRRADPIHLFCFSYDRVTGRYTATVMDIVRMAAALTVLIVGAVLLRMARRP